MDDLAISKIEYIRERLDAAGNKTSAGPAEHQLWLAVRALTDLVERQAQQIDYLQGQGRALEVRTQGLQVLG